MMGVILQVVLVLAAVISVPIMLLPKPFILKKRHEARQAQLAHYGRVSPHDEEAGGDESPNLRLTAAHHDEEEEFDFGEIIVHQVGTAMKNPSLAGME
jgi:V-type H+-transporting ATPase subunit a